jgi:hypothetical protein
LKKKDEEIRKLLSASKAAKRFNYLIAEHEK